VKFSDEWDQIKKTGNYGSFSFGGTADEWRSAVSSHFMTATLERPCYGVYVVSQISTGNIVYVGKSGTVCQDGSFKDEDLPKRLINREKNQSRKDVFGQRVMVYGKLLIEYVVLKSKSLIPGYLEARLLQAYFDEYKELPIDNTSL
jgi:hypothetical protein